MEPTSELKSESAMEVALDQVANAYVKNASHDKLLTLLSNIPEDVKDKFARDHAKKNINVFISILDDELNKNSLELYLHHNIEIIENYINTCTDSLENITDETKCNIITTYLKNTPSEKLLTLFENIPENDHINFYMAVLDYIINHPSIFIDAISDPRNFGKLKDYLNRHPEIINDLTIIKAEEKASESVEAVEAVEAVEVDTATSLPSFLTDGSLIDVQNDKLSYANGIIMVNQLDKIDQPIQFDVHIDLLISKSTRMNQHKDEVKLAMINLLQDQLRFNANVKIKSKVVTFDTIAEFLHEDDICNTVSYLQNNSFDLDANKQDLYFALLQCIEVKRTARLKFVLIFVDNDDNNKLSTEIKLKCIDAISKSNIKFIIIGTDASGIGYKLGIPRENCFTSEFLIDDDFGNALGNASKYILIERAKINL